MHTEFNSSFADLLRTKRTPNFNGSSLCDSYSGGFKIKPMIDKEANKKIYFKNYNLFKVNDYNFSNFSSTSTNSLSDDVEMKMMPSIEERRSIQIKHFHERLQKEKALYFSKKKSLFLQSSCCDITK